MDITLSDGTIIKNVPEGMTETDVVAKLKSNGHNTSAYEKKAEPTWPPAGFGQAVDAQNAKDVSEQAAQREKDNLHVAGASIPSWLTPALATTAGAAAYLTYKASKAGAKPPEIPRIDPTLGRVVDPHLGEMFVNPSPIQDVPQVPKVEPVNLKDKLAAIQQATGAPQATPQTVAQVEAQPVVKVEPVVQKTVAPNSPIDVDGRLKVPDVLQPPEGVPLSAEERQIARLQAQSENLIKAGREPQTAAVRAYATANPLPEKVLNTLHNQLGGTTAKVAMEAGLGPQTTIAEAQAAAKAAQAGAIPNVPTMSGVSPVEVPAGKNGLAFGKAPPNFPENQFGRITPKGVGALAAGAGALAAAPYVIDAYKKGKLDPLLNATPVVGTLRKGGTPIDAILNGVDFFTDFNPYIGTAKLLYSGAHAINDMANESEQKRKDAIKYNSAEYKFGLKKRYEDMTPNEQQADDDKFFGRPNALNELKDSFKKPPRFNQKLSQEDIKFISKYFR